jgi:hypothetical protein
MFPKEGVLVRDNLARLRGLIGSRGLLPVRSADGFSGEVPFTFVAVAPPQNIPEETDFDTFNALMSRSEFIVRFDDGTLLDGRNTKRLRVLRSPRTASVSLGML